MNYQKWKTIRIPGVLTLILLYLLYVQCKIDHSALIKQSPVDTQT